MRNAHPTPTCPAHGCAHGMRLIVCGGRDYADEKRVWAILREYLPYRPHIVTGGARGADRLATRFATMHNLPRTVIPAEWETHGRAAGAIRNEAMAKAGADLCIAFPGGAGTADMKRRARYHRIEVRVIEAPGLRFDGSADLCPIPPSHG